MSPLDGQTLNVDSKPHLTVLSLAPDTALCPSELTTTLVTLLVWPVNVCSNSPLSRSQTLCVRVDAKGSA